MRLAKELNNLLLAYIHRSAASALLKETSQTNPNTCGVFCSVKRGDNKWDSICKRENRIIESQNLVLSAKNENFPEEKEDLGNSVIILFQLLNDCPIKNAMQFIPSFMLAEWASMSESHRETDPETKSELLEAGRET